MSNELTVTEANQVLSAINTLRRIFPELDPSIGDAPLQDQITYGMGGNPATGGDIGDEGRSALAHYEQRAIAVRDADQAKRMAEYAQKMATPVDLGPRLGEVDRRKLYTIVVKVMETRRGSGGYKTYDTGKRTTLKHRQPLRSWGSWGNSKGKVGTLDDETGREIGSVEWESAGGQKRRLAIAEIESVTEETP
jgi:hypothetical protein